jgi:signal transduction histidine kinase
MTLAVPRPGAGSPTDQVETTLFRALAVLRMVVLAYAIALNAVRWDDFAYPAAVAAVMVGITVWSGFVTWAYDDPQRRRPGLFVADLVVSCLALLSTPLVQSQAMLERHASTIPSFWVMAAVLAWAVHRGWAGGVGAALITTACDLSVRTEPTGTTWGNIFLLLLAAGVVGYSTARLREATEARAAAERVAATMQERARLARVVHDGVLQVLALVQRRGLELGGDAAELGRLAGEQEVALRALVQGNSVALTSGPSTTAGDADLAERLRRLAGSSVTVSAPGGPVLLPAGVVEELDLVVRACLDNVARHVGPDAPAWVLVEDLGDSVVVTVRDEGPGIPEGRLDEAAADGRLGVRESVRGRMADLGGTASLYSTPGQGTEWELSVPRG